MSIGRKSHFREKNGHFRDDFGSGTVGVTTMYMSSLFRRTIGSLAVAVLAVALSRPGIAHAQSAIPVTSASRLSVPTDYRIRAGDNVSLSVFGEPGLTEDKPVTVLPGGTIAVPLVGVVTVGGMTTRQASNAIARKLQRYLRSPKVTLSVVSLGQVVTLVLGNVKTPGKYALEQPARVTDVIAAAGGLGPTDGDLPTARLVNPDGSITQISLQKLLRDGDTSLNVPVANGTEVYVPAPTTFDIRVLGAVAKPGDVALHEGDDLAMAIARAAPSEQENPDLNNIVVTRTSLDGKTTTTKVNLYDILKKGDLSLDMKMQKGDLVYVPSSPKKGPGLLDGLGLLRRFIIPF